MALRRGRCRLTLRRGRCPPHSAANRRRALGGKGGNYAFFSSARDQSLLYKLELLPPSDERARPRRYPAAPAPGAGAALTLTAPSGPAVAAAPPSQPGTRQDGTRFPVLQPTPISLAKRRRGKHDPYPHLSMWFKE